MNAFESRQFQVLRDLVNKDRRGSSSSKTRSAATNMEHDPADEHSGKRYKQADTANQPSFKFTAPNPFAPSTPEPTRMTRNSADNINTRFVAEEHSNVDWQFNAGGAVGQTPNLPYGRRSQSSSRLGRRSPTKDWPPPPPPPSNHEPAASMMNESGAGTMPGGFNAGQWNQKIGVEHFVPEISVSPSRPPAPRQSKKARPIQKTMGTAGMVDEEETSSEEDKTRPPTAAENVDTGMESPVAMDIDPPATSDEPPTATETNGNGVRNIPVEPSREEWRAGRVNGISRDGYPNVALPQQTPFNINNAAGSEDTDDFQTSFADFRNVEPIANPATGLGSFSDLKSNLPFESQPSARIPIQKLPRKNQHITFPKPPVAPRQPLTVAVVAWDKYINEFNQYLIEWHKFNNLYVTHFAERRGAVQGLQGEGGFAFLSTRADDGILEYQEWLEQDDEVHARWSSASHNHLQRIREFTAYRNRMKAS